MDMYRNASPSPSSASQQNYPDRREQMPSRPNNTQQSPNNPIVQFTPDELSALKECRRNAIIQRGIPMGLLSVTGYYYFAMVRKLKNKAIGLVVSGLVGNFLGVASYSSICMDRLMSLPNSTLKERILAAQGKQVPVSVELDKKENYFDSVLPLDNSPMYSSLDIEPYQANEFDGYTSSSFDAEAAYAVDPPLQPVHSGSFTTYDELRRRNRESYEKQNMRSPQSSSGPPPSSSTYSPPPPSYASSQSYSSSSYDM